MAIPARAILYRSLFAIALISLLTTAVLPGIAFGLPLVAITRPTQGSTVSGVIWIDVAFRSDSNKPITRLEVYIDDTLAREQDLASPLLEGRQSFNWDFTYVSNTVHKISARAIDSGGNANTAAITVSVQSANVGGPDQIPPVVRIYYPAQGAKLRGPVEIKAEAQDNVGVESVYFYIDGKLHKMMMQAPPYVDLWDTSREGDGKHELEAVAFDAAENEARSARVTVIVENHAMTLAAAGTDSNGGGSVLPTLPSVPVGPVAPTVETPAPPVSASQPLGSSAALPTAPPAPAPQLTLPGVGGPTQIMRTPVSSAGTSAPVTPPSVATDGALPLPTAGSQASRPSLAGPVLSSGSQPTASLSGPRVALVTPRAKALEPVPQAPATTSLTLAPEAPVSVRTSRPAALNDSAALPLPVTTKTATLTRPGLAPLSGPAAASSTGLTKTASPRLSPEIAPAATMPHTAATTAVAPMREPVRTSQNIKPLVTRVVSSTAPHVGSAGLAPLSSSAPPLSRTWQPSGLPGKASATTAALPTHSASPVAGAAAPASAPVPVKAGLAPLSMPTKMPAVHTTVTPVGPATVASTREPAATAPVVAVTPVTKTAPDLTARVSSPAKTATTARPVKTVASVIRPSIAPATLVQAALTAAGNTPIAAARMLARLPEPAEFGQLPADGRMGKPQETTAAVPLAVVKVRDIKIVFDGEVLTLRAAPETRRGLSLAPLREIFEHTDGVLYWFPVEKQVRAVNKSVEMKLSIGNPKVQVNGETKVLEIAPYIKQGRTMIPLQFIAETLDVAITFDSQTGNILICSNQQ